MKLIYILLFATFMMAQDHHDDENTEGDEHKDELHISPKMFDEIGIRLTKQRSLVLEESIFAHGEIISTPNGLSIVGTLLSGRVEKVHVMVGQDVQKGDVLFEMSSLEIIELVDEHFSTEADYIRAKKQFNRVKGLKKDNIGSEKAYYEAQSDYEKSKASYESADRKIHALGFTDKELKELAESDAHSKTVFKVKAPTTGVITEFEVRNGQFINEDISFAKILNSKELWARIHVFEKDASDLKVGAKVTLNPSSMPNKKIFGRVIDRSSSLMSSNRALEVIVKVEPSDHLLIGASVTATIYKSAGKSSIVLPSESVIDDEGQSFVFVQEKEGEFKKQAVIIGQEVDGFIEILSGLSKDDTVVEKGTFYLKALSRSGNLGGHAH